MIYDPIEFFSRLTNGERFDVLRFARAYMRVRELHNDTSLMEFTRLEFAALEAKLAEQMGEE